MRGSLDYEACDDANINPLDACTNACDVARCGDGFAREDIAEGEDGFEGCDDGNLVQTDACLNDCAVARCGDGQIHAGVEACDDGNQNDSDGCDNSCRETTKPLAIGLDVSCILCPGTPYCMGRNSHGEVGDGTTNQRALAYASA